MPDLRKMTVQSLRELARKVLGPGHTRLKTKNELVKALEDAGAAEPAGGLGKASAAKPAGKAAVAKASAPSEKPVARVRAAAAKAVEATGKAVKAAKDAAGRAAEKVPGRAAKAAAAGVAVGAKAAPPKAEPPNKAGKVAKAAKAAAAVAGAAVGAAVGAANAAATVRAKMTAKAGARGGKAKAKELAGTDPDGYFVARVRGENAVRDAPHPLVESDEAAEEGNGVLVQPVFEEDLGDLPWGYGDDAFVALPRDPRTLFLYWDFGKETLARGFEGLDHPRTQLWVFARAGAGWDRVRTLDFALEARGFYVHDLEPGRVYRAEIHVLDRQGQERPLARSSNEVSLPPIGPSSIVDDRFIRIPWDIQLGKLLGPGHPGGAFPEDVRAMLARLSDWSRFSGKTVWGGSAGGMGGRPSSPSAAPSSPSSPVGRSGEER